VLQQVHANLHNALLILKPRNAVAQEKISLVTTKTHAQLMYVIKLKDVSLPTLNPTNVLNTAKLTPTVLNTETNISAL
jgi:hypothetical protein